MKKLILLGLLIQASCWMSAQCDCPAQTFEHEHKVVVSDVAELNDALSFASSVGGDVQILLEDGDYLLTNNLLYINPEMTDLTIRSVSGNRDDVIIRGQGMAGDVGYIFNVAADRFRLLDVTIGWVGYHAVQIHAEHDADECLIQNVRFVDVKEQMLKVSGSSSSDFSDGGIVQCCLFEFPDGVAYQYYTGGIDAHHAKDWEVRNNTFKHIRSPDGSLAEHAIHFWSDSENTLVENNLIIDCDRGIGFGLGSSGHSGGVIRNNMVHTSRDVGIGLESAPDVQVYHNTVVTENYFNSIEYRFEETENVHVANNLTTQAIASRDGGSGLIESNVADMGIAIFSDPYNYDFHLTGPLPSIIDAGIKLPGIDIDYDCHARPFGNGPDIGADEFESVPTSIDNQLEAGIDYHPNPTDGILYIDLPIASRLNIFSVDGAQLTGLDLPRGQQEIDLSALPSGTYVLVFNAHQSSWKAKAIIQRH